MTSWYYTYVLQSESDQSTYIGSTSDLRKRLLAHNSGKTKSIKNKLPMRLIYCEAYRTKRQAIKREIQLKKSSKVKEALFARIFSKE